MAKYIPSGNVRNRADINGEFDKIAEAINDQLDKTGGSGNQMEASLDMNSERIINLPEPISPTEPARLQDLREILEALSGGIPEDVEPYTYTEVLTSGQLEVSTPFRIEDCIVFVSGNVVDSALLVSGVDYTPIGLNLTLAVSYPAGTLLTVVRVTRTLIVLEGNTGPSTVTEITTYGEPVASGTVLEVSGFAVQGDGGSSTWLKTAETGTPSQLPAQRGDGTLTDASGAVWRLVVSGVLDPRAVGFTGSGDETATLTAAASAVGEDGQVKLNTSYSFSITTLNMGATHFDFANSSIETLTTGFGILSEGSFSNRIAVTNVSGNTLVTDGVLGDDGVTFKPSDIVKITSTDEQADYWTARRFLGQFAVVISVVGNTITLDRDVFDDTLYQTNVSLFRLDGKSSSIKNVTIRPSDTLTDHASLVEFRSMYKPVVENLHTVNAKDTSVAYVSCYEYQHLNCSVKNALDSQGTGNLGYGVYDASSHAGYILNLQVNNCRHAFTNGGFASSDGSVDPRCGYSTDARIVSGIARFATTGAWDTHPGIINTTFENCQAYNSANFGQSRARNTVFINPYGRDLTVAIAAAAGRPTSTLNPVKGTRVINPDLDYSQTAIAYYTDEAIAQTDVGDIYVEGGSLNPAGDYRGFLLEARNAPIKCTFKDVDMSVASLDTDAAVFLGLNAGNEISVNGLTIESDTNNGGGFGIVRGQSSFSGTAHTVCIQNVTMRGTGLEDLALYAATNMDAHVYNVRVKSIGTGSLTAVVNGTSLTWGGVV